MSYLVGNRDAKTAKDFMQEVSERLGNCVQLATDALKSYMDAVEDAFGGDIDYAKLVKLYGETTTALVATARPNATAARKSA